MRYLSLFSGIDAATQALHPLGGFQPAAFSEIEPHPCAVLKHRFPHVPNLGDITKHKEWPDIGTIDLICGGSPCQSFSVAGLRKGMADPRGNLLLSYLAVVDQYRPRWVLYENVPGILSSNGGRDFGAFLGALGQLGYGVAYRVLDAQFVRTRGKPRAVPQRRRRVFVIGYLGDWRRAAAVLFDRESLRRDPAPRREAGQGSAATAAGRTGSGSHWDGTGAHPSLNQSHNAGGIGLSNQELFSQRGAGLVAAEVSTSLDASMGRLQGASGQDANHGHSTLVAMSSGQANAETAHDHSPALTCLHEAPIVVQPVAPTLRGEGFDATDDGTGKGTPIIPVAYPLPVAGTLSSNGDGPGKHGFGMGQQDWENGYAVPVVFDSKGTQVQTDDTGTAPTLRAMTHADSHQNGGGQPAVAYSIQAGAVRENPASGPDGVGVQDGHAYTLEARAEVQAVAFSTEPHKPVGVRQEGANGNATKTDTGEILRGVRDALGEEAFSQWGLGILDMLQSPEILRSALHGRELRPAPFTRRWVVDCALSRQEDRGAWAVQSLREAGGHGCASSGWEPSEQRAHELGAYLSELSQPGAQAERFMLDLWRASEGIGLLREALSAVQEARRPSRGEGQPAQTTWKVRRLTPDECEFLQGMPRGMTNVPWRGKDFSPDGNRYKELGNSWALNCIEWIGERMLIVDAWD